MSTRLWLGGLLGVALATFFSGAHAQDFGGFGGGRDNDGRGDNLFPAGEPGILGIISFGGGRDNGGRGDNLFPADGPGILGIISFGGGRDNGGRGDNLFPAGELRIIRLETHLVRDLERDGANSPAVATLEAEFNTLDHVHVFRTGRNEPTGEDLFLGLRAEPFLLRLEQDLVTVFDRRDGANSSAVKTLEADLNRVDESLGFGPVSFH